jgi:hypothetical protein
MANAPHPETRRGRASKQSSSRPEPLVPDLRRLSSGAGGPCRLHLVRAPPPRASWQTDLSRVKNEEPTDPEAESKA